MARSARGRCWAASTTSTSAPLDRTRTLAPLQPIAGPSRVSLRFLPPSGVFRGLGWPWGPSGSWGFTTTLVREASVATPRVALGSAAVVCATRGLRVRLYERDTFAGDRPGETLRPGSEPLLAQFGVGGDLARVEGARHAGVWIEWGGPRRLEACGADERSPWPGYQVWRPDFDALLCARARQAGAVVCRP